MSDVLQDAANVIEGARQSHYGNPDVNIGRTAELWSAYLGRRVTERDVCMLNILQKVSRDVFCGKRDNLVDIAGYARCAELITDKLTGVSGSFAKALQSASLDPVAKAALLTGETPP